MFKIYQQAVILFALLFTITNASSLNSSAVFDLEISHDQRIEAIRAQFDSYRDKYNVPPNQINRNPVLSYSGLLIDICKNNVDGNYNIPGYCNYFCMCSGGTPYLWECPGGGAYNCIADMCVYQPRPGQETCPWNSIWTYPGGVTCATLGQRMFWGFLTFPKKPDVICGPEIVYCLKYQQVRESRCPPGTGYSRKFFACLPIDSCRIIELRSSREIEHYV